MNIFQRLGELELTLHQQEDMNRTLEDQLHKSRNIDAEQQDRMENTQRELNDLRQKLKETDRKLQVSDRSSKINIAELHTGMDIFFLFLHVVGGRSYKIQYSNKTCSIR